jgi:hypothetical protein
MRKYSALLLGLFVTGVMYTQHISSARAETTALPPGVFLMADGVYYHPKSGAKSTDIAFVLAAYQSFFQKEQTVTSTVPVTMGESLPSFPLLAAIERGQALLAAAEQEAEGVVVETIPDWRAIRLAVWNEKTDALRTISAEINEKKVRSVSGNETVKVLRANGVNSSFQISSGSEGDIVIAMRYPIYRERSDKKFDVEQAIYTPYHNSFNTDQMAAAGETWLAQVIDAAEKELRDVNAHSRAYPDMLLSEVIDPSFVASILTIEHVDFSAAQKDVKAQIGAFYSILATNKDRSYAYSRSSAGALGIAQFIPKTYAWLAKQPELTLAQDFDKGMIDPKNAVKAQIAYLDYLLSVLPRDARDAYLLPASRLLVQEYIAAAYNGGPAKVKKAMVVWDENLDEEERLHVRTRSRLKLETVHYIWKLRLVRPVLIERFRVLEKV